MCKSKEYFNLQFWVIYETIHLRISRETIPNAPSPPPPLSCTIDLGQ